MTVQADDELTLKKGTRVVAYQIDDDGWWTVCNGTSI